MTTKEIQKQDTDGIQGLIDAFHMRNVGEEIFDPSTGERIVVTPALLTQAAMAHASYAQAEQNRWSMAFMVRANKLWAAWPGCQSFEDFVQKCWHLGGSQGRLLARRGERRFLMINAAGDRGTEAEKALDKLSRSEQSALYDLPKAAYEELITDLYQCPDGRELDLAELTKEVAKDVVTKNKALKSQLSDSEETIKGLEAEIKQLRKISSGESSQAAEAMLKIEKLQDKLEKLQGERKQGEAAQKILDTAKSNLQQAYVALIPYVPRDAEEYEAGREANALAFGVITEYCEKLEQLRNAYVRVKMQAEGD